MFDLLLSQRLYNPQIIEPFRDFSWSQYSERLFGILVLLGFIICVVAFIILLMSGGIQWITSGANKQSLESARNKIVNAVTGLIVLFLLWLILQIINLIFGINIGDLGIPSFGGRPTTAPVLTVTPSSLPDQIICEAGGGVWRLLPTTCRDICGADEMACGNMLTWGCDCGDGYCWDGSICIADSASGPTSTTVPTPTSGPSPTATRTPTPTPSATRTPTPIPTSASCSLIIRQENYLDGLAPSATLMGQSFTGPGTYTVDYVEFCLHSYNPYWGIQLRNGENINGTILGTAIVNNTGISCGLYGWATWFRGNFNPGVPIVNGQMYTVRIDQPDGAYYPSWANINSYPGGRLYEGTGWNSYEDFMFRIHGCP